MLPVTLLSLRHYVEPQIDYINKSIIYKAYRASSVCIATCYGLDGPGIESRWGRDFTHTSGPAVVSTQPHVQWIPCHSLGVKRPERGAHHPPQSKCRGHERVGLYLYSPSGPQWPVVGRALPLCG